METGFSPDPNPFESPEERIKRIPLPNQLPKGLDFTGIPAAALRSSTLESLISQNEDLMARLSVSLRKINELEGTVTRGERDLTHLRTRFEALNEQFLVLREKDRISAARAAELQRENIASRDRGDKMERQFAALFVQSQAFQRRVQHLERYRARVTKAAVGLRERARESTELRRDLTTAEVELATLTESFERRMNEARQQIDSLRVKADEHDRLIEVNLTIENQIIVERRLARGAAEDAAASITRLTTNSEALSEELKALRATHDEQRLDLEALAKDVPELRREREALSEQVESLQDLWASKQRELDRAEEKNLGLQKLNQSLSQTMNESRREMQELRSIHEQERFAVENRFRTLREEIKMLRRQLQTKD